MYRISTSLMKKRHCLVLINGESVGQVASQTLTSLEVINAVTNTPIIRPVACLDKLEIIDIAKKINTYETSILPYEDCCTIFLPKHPVINPKIDKCLEYYLLYFMDYFLASSNCTYINVFHIFLFVVYLLENRSFILIIGFAAFHEFWYAIFYYIFIQNIFKFY